jgi:hypothetical protein
VFTGQESGRAAQRGWTFLVLNKQGMIEVILDNVQLWVFGNMAMVLGSYKW